MSNFKETQFLPTRKVVFCYLSLNANWVISNREPSWLEHWNHPVNQTAAQRIIWKRAWRRAHHLFPNLPEKRCRKSRSSQPVSESSKRETHPATPKLTTPQWTHLVFNDQNLFCLLWFEQHDAKTPKELWPIQMQSSGHSVLDVTLDYSRNFLSLN